MEVNQMNNEPIEKILIFIIYILKYKYLINQNIYQFLYRYQQASINMLVYLVILCLTLQSGLAANAVAYTCNVPNCNACSYINTCGMCNTNYTLSLNTATGQYTCTQLTCSIPNCNYCYSNGICASCATGTTLQTNGQCTNNAVPTCNIPNCAACTNSSYCGLCNIGYYLSAVNDNTNPTNGQCFNSTLYVFPFCAVMLNAASCQLCVTGYYVGPDGNCVSMPSFNCTVNNCYYCASNNNCSLCQPGFLVASDGSCSALTCIGNIANCIVCSTTTTCTTCAQNYILSSDSSQCNLYVQGCNVANCLNCVSPGNCINCNTGYVLSFIPVTGKWGCQSYQCPPMVQNCQYCIPFFFNTVNTNLTVGCGQCQTGYNNIGGYCVASISSISCSSAVVPNCLYCAANNYCWKCNPGYLAISGSCQIQTCNVPNCAQCYNLNSCQTCNTGYYANNNFTCSPINTAFSCTLMGCSYCQNNGSACTQCVSGYSLNTTSNTCYPTCDVANCYTCGANDTVGCILCNPGFTLGQGGAVCNTISFSCNAQCTNCTFSIFKNASQCWSCSIGFTLYQNQCYNNSCNMWGCQTCYNWLPVPQCIVCKQGLVLVNNNCAKFPCSIGNCSFCLASDVCLGCAESFTLLGNACVAYTPNATCPINCKTCSFSSSLNKTICNACASGYQVDTNGNCACQWQNCLGCSNMAYCQVCAYPTIATISTPGCVPMLNFIQACNVANCRYCSQISNACSVCANGYSISSTGTCVQNACTNVPNCQLCTASTTLANDICFLCNQGYFLEKFLYNCTLIPANYGCLVQGCFRCSSNSSVCLQCSTNYILNSNATCTLLSCPQNCAYCFTQNNVCSICTYGYYLNQNLTCTATLSNLNCSGIKGCQACSLIGGTSRCTACYPGFVPNVTSNTCVAQKCPIPNCAYCGQGYPYTYSCYQCVQGYRLTSYLQCVALTPSVSASACNVYNCEFCYASGSCAFCPTGWNNTQGICTTNLYCNSAMNCATCTSPDVCMTCNLGATLSNSSCVTCNIVGCVLCQVTNVCTTCSANFVNNNGSACNCASPFSVTGSTCGCPSGTSLASGQCINCTVANCASCSTANVCGTCVSTTYVLSNGQCSCPTNFTAYNSVCYSCAVSNCNICYGTNFCGQCSGDFIPTSAGQCTCKTNFTLSGTTCISCPIVNCNSCSSAGVCSSCINNYSLNNNKTCVYCNILNCVSCFSAGFCSSCTGTLVLNQQQTQCLTCSVLNCLTCQTATTCAICMDGFTLSTASLCVVCDVPGCQLCSATNTCASCFSGYVQNGQGCTLCTLPCTTCNSNGTCATCTTPLYAQNANAGVCYSCQISNCIACSVNNLQNCTQCIPGYVVSVSGNSTQCTFDCADPNCNNCNSNNVCTSCNMFYVLNLTNNCIMCNDAPICQQCDFRNASICTLCNNGFYLSSGQCLLCPSYCATCTNNNTCQTLKISSGYILILNNIIAQCNEGCKTCSQTNPNQCLTCMLGYSILGGYCIPCSYPCLTCEDNGPTNCTSCYGNAFLRSNNTCTPCTAPCLTCASSANVSYCTSCYTGYYLSTTGTCVQNCPQNCLVCSGPNNCITCASGYGLNATKACVPCQTNCRQCLGIYVPTCLQCGYGFTLLANGTCKSCPTYCLTCVPLGCLTCATGYSLTTSLGCAANCQSPCAGCTTSSPTQCTSCIAGYTYNSATSTCSSNISCNNNSTCIVCPFGYILNGQTCTACGSNCARCQIANTTACTACNMGFYLSSSTCVQCPQGCSMCSSQSVCQMCSAGWVSVTQVASIPQTCTACQFPCATCIASPTICTTCNSNYFMQGTTCISSYYFQITISLNYNITQFFATQYDDFLVAYANLLGGLSLTNISFYNFLNGSTTIYSQVNLNATNPDNVQYIYNNVNDFIQPNDQIAGMSVLYATINVFGGQTPALYTYTNVLAIVLGVCIPVVVIIIVVIIVVIYCRNKKSSNVIEKKINEDGLTVRETFELSNDMTGRKMEVI